MVGSAFHCPWLCLLAGALISPASAARSLNVFTCASPCLHQVHPNERQSRWWNPRFAREHRSHGHRTVRCRTSGPRWSFAVQHVRALEGPPKLALGELGERDEGVARVQPASWPLPRVQRNQSGGALAARFFSPSLKNWRATAEKLLTPPRMRVSRLGGPSSNDSATHFRDAAPLAVSLGPRQLPN